MEASVMKSYQHKHLMNAVVTDCRKDGLYMVLDLAQCDLLAWRRKNSPTSTQLRKFTFQIGLALKYMHDHGVLHGDVKASNVLLHQESPIQVKLSDFNLSSHISWNSERNVCTATHRPIEVWMKEGWNEKIDIWSLGITMHELYYNNILIPYQGDRKKIHRESLKKKYVNAMLDWGERRSKIYRSKLNKREKFRIDYIKPKDREYFNSKNRYISLMVRILAINPEDRPSIDQILQRSYFTGLSKSIPSKRMIKRRNRLQLDQNIVLTSKDPNTQDMMITSFHTKMRNELSYYIDDSDILEAATHIYSQYYLVEKKIDITIKMTCVWMAKK